MTTRKKKPAAAPEPAPRTVIQNCSFVSNTAANEHTRAAVVALADACRENAVALAKAAEALRGGEPMRTAIYIASPTEDR